MSISTCRCGSSIASLETFHGGGLLLLYGADLRPLGAALKTTAGYIPTTKEQLWAVSEALDFLEELPVDLVDRFRDASSG